MQIDQAMRISNIFAWFEGVLEAVPGVLPNSEAKKEDIVSVGRNITAAESNKGDHAEALLMQDHVEERLNEIRLKKSEISSSMKERFQIATTISDLRQKTRMPDHVFKVKLQKKIDTYSQADIAVKGARQELGRLEQNHQHLCDTEIAVFNRRPSHESEASSQGSKATPRFPNFPFSFSQRAWDVSRSKNSAEARSTSPVRSLSFTRAAATISPDALAPRAKSSER